MNRKQKMRCYSILSVCVCLSIALGLVLFALRQNINLFYTPTELIQAAKSQHEQQVRVGGMVKQHSVHYSQNGSVVQFAITDQQNALQVQYQGLLPALFREGQGVVITGKFINQTLFEASQVLAKHDEKYMPWKSLSGAKK